MMMFPTIDLAYKNDLLDEDTYKQVVDVLRLMCRRVLLDYHRRSPMVTVQGLLNDYEDIVKRSLIIHELTLLTCGINLTTICREFNDYVIGSFSVDVICNVL